MGMQEMICPKCGSPVVMGGGYMFCILCARFGCDFHTPDRFTRDEAYDDFIKLKEKEGKNGLQ
jgi:hypothetical protein